MEIDYQLLISDIIAQDLLPISRLKRSRKAILFDLFYELNF